MNKKNNRKGFTIVELVIVIAVIAILATVLVPTFGNVIEKADKTAAVQDARNDLTEYFVKEPEAAATLDAVTNVGDYWFAIVDGNLKQDNEGNVALYESKEAAVNANRAGLVFTVEEGDPAAAVEKIKVLAAGAVTPENAPAAPAQNP